MIRAKMMRMKKMNKKIIIENASLVISSASNILLNLV
jgi:hypothetical protein